MKVSINFENCFGIGKFRHQFDFTRFRTILIYSPNGTMKSSFANTMMHFSKGEVNKVKDRLHPDRPTLCEIKDEHGADIPSETIFVANGDDAKLDNTNRFSAFLASDDVHNQYVAVYDELNTRKAAYLSRLSSLAQSPDCEKEVRRTFSPDKEVPLEFYDILLNLKDTIQQDYRRFTFRYNAVFDNDGKVKSFVTKHSALFQDYFTSYVQLLQDSDFFHAIDATMSFGTYQATELLNAVKDNAFFAAGHRIRLGNGRDISTKDELDTEVANALSSIFANPALKKKLEKLTKDLDANENTRACKQILESDPALIPCFLQYDEFQKEYWYGCFHELLVETNELIALYEAKQAELAHIIAEARQQQSKWEEIVTTYNERFHVPFKVEIKNVEDIVLKQDVAQLKFVYTDQQNQEVETNKKQLTEILSRGEQRAFFIMQILFEIEARKAKAEDSLIVLDDIADSFDYNNKFAIIEYINDMNKHGRFYTIVLTHNFDFYRTLSTRLGLGNTVFMTTKDVDGKIALHNGEYRGDLFKSLSSGARTSERKLVSLIPFVRNLIEYTHGIASAEYLNLTFCMHVKAGYTDVLSIGDIVNLFKTAYPARCSSITVSDNNENIKDFVLRVADNIESDVNNDEIMIENKIVLSMACRLRAETYMIDKLSLHPESMAHINAITSNQARGIYDEYIKLYNDNKDLLERVNLMTPEGIHINSFMYEPLIDSSLSHLLALYGECKANLI